MKIEKVSFDKKFGMPAYGSDHPVVVEATLEGDETPEQAWSEMNRRMIAWHRAEYPNLYQPSTEFVPIAMGGTIDKPKVIDYRAIEELEKAIDNAQTIDELKSIKEQNPIMPAKLIDQYNRRVKKLTAK